MFEYIFTHIQEVSLLISAFAVLVAVVSVIAAFCANRQNKKQYTASVQPQLTMSLVEFDSRLYLRVKNTGKTAAKNIKVTVNKIANNGTSGKLSLDDLFNSDFELYPEEIVQGQVAFCGRSLCCSVFPVVDIDVSYTVDDTKKKYNYNRSVTYQSAYTEKIMADVNFDTRQMEDALSGIARSSVRVANYLDGRQVAAFDELNILAKRSLKNDLLEICQQETKHILTRAETIDEALCGGEDKGNADT